MIVKCFSKEQQVILLVLGLAVFSIALLRPFHPFWSTLRSSADDFTAESRAQWIIEVTGAVKNPGIYNFDESPTAYHAIQRAGGPNCGHRFLPDTVCNALDTGVRLELQVSKGECSRIIITPMDSGKRLVLGIPIALNEARFEDLAMIPGISQGLSHRIIKFRESHGPFKTWNDLKRVKGIGPKRMQKFRCYLTLK